MLLDVFTHINPDPTLFGTMIVLILSTVGSVVTIMVLSRSIVVVVCHRYQSCCSVILSFWVESIDGDIHSLANMSKAAVCLEFGVFAMRV
jgi:ABC-type uncharacterized transport system permease subunit